MRTLLVTGASGFVGRHFIASAVQRGYDITATGRGYAPEWLPSAVNWISSDISTANGLADVAHEYWGVAHFANISKPADYADETIVSESVQMVANLSNHIGSARLLFPSSCHVYKASGALKNEDSETAPTGLYGRAKLEAERFLLALKHIDVRIARPFNHIGPYMPSGLMVPSLAERVRAAKAGAPIIMHGRNSVRDFLDVRDIVSAYFALLEMDDPAHRVLNVCSGRGVNIRTLAEHFVEQAGKDNPVHFDEQSVSLDDIDFLVGDPVRMTAATGWKAVFSLEQSISELL